MMSKRFRKSLFGFNTDDVLAYIAATDKAANDKKAELEAKISDLASQVEGLNSLNSQLSEIVAEYESKKEQIRIMSENIARMYISAKTTSKILVEKAEESSKLISDESKDRLNILSSSQISMEAIREQVTSAASQYCLEVERLYASLEDVKNSINTNDNEVALAKEEFEALVSENV